MTAQDGSLFAFLGGVPDSDVSDGNVSGNAVWYHTTLSQGVTIPADAGVLWLDGWVWIESSEPDITSGAPEDTLDRAYIQLVPLIGEAGDWSADETEFRLFWKKTYENATGGWERIHEPIGAEEGDAWRLQTVLGREVAFVIQAATDGMHPTRFWFDSLTLTASCDEPEL